jgi:pimeloyl-ACP methyl ester carboxylesterase
VVPEGSLSALEVEAERLREISIGAQVSLDADRAMRCGGRSVTLTGPRYQPPSRRSSAPLRIASGRRFRREGAVHVGAEQAEHRLLPWPLADGSCFSKVIAPLQAEGYQVIAAQYGLDTPEEDVATVIRTLGRVDSPAILVGHSYGGTVITAAGGTDIASPGWFTSPRWLRTPTRPPRACWTSPPPPTFRAHRGRRRTHLASPKASSASPATPRRPSSNWSGRRTTRPPRTCSPATPRASRGDRSPARTSWPATTAPSIRTSSASWSSAWAPRPTTSTSSHVPMLSHPDLVLDVIRTSANAVQGAATAGAV